MEEESTVFIHDIWLHKESTKLLTTSTPPAATTGETKETTDKEKDPKEKEKIETKPGILKNPDRSSLPPLKALQSISAAPPSGQSAAPSTVARNRSTATSRKTLKVIKVDFDRFFKDYIEKVCT